MTPWRKTYYAVLIAQTLSITGFFFAIPLLPLYIAELHPEMSQEQLSSWSGIMLAAKGLTMAVAAPIWGFVADRYGRKPMILRAMWGGVAILFLMGLAQNVTQLIILRILQGCVTGVVTASIALVASVSPRDRSGQTLGMMQGAVFFGVCLGPFLGGEIAEHLGFMPAFFTAAGLLLISGLLVLLFADEKFEQPAPSKQTHFGTLGTILGTTGFVAAMAALFLIRFANSSFQPIFPYILRNILGSDEGVRALTGRIIGVAGIASAVSAGLLGWVSDRWGHKRLLIGSVIFAAFITLALALADTIPQFYLLRAMYGFAAAGIMPSANAIIRRIIDDKHLGKAYGLVASLKGLGWGAGAFTGGYVAAGIDLRAPFLLTTVVLLLSAGLVMWRVQDGDELAGEEEDATIKPETKPADVYRPARQPASD